MRIPILIILFLSIRASLLLAQQNYVVQKHIVGIEDGLLGNYATAAYQDSKSIMWIGTQYGLNSYNGISVGAYTSAKNNLAGDYIKSILEDKNGRIWVLCLDQYGASKAKGISIVDPIKKAVVSLEEYTSIADGFSSKDVQLLTTSTDGEVIICTDENRVYKYTGEDIELLIDGKNSDWTYWGLDDILINDSISSRFQIINSTKILQFYNYKQNSVLEEFDLQTKNAYFKFYGQDSLNNYFWGVGYWSGRLDTFSQTFYEKRPNHTSKFIQERHFLANINSLFVNRSKNLQKIVLVDATSVSHLQLDGSLIKRKNRSDAHKFTAIRWLDSLGGIWYVDIESGYLCYERYIVSKFKTIRHNYPNPSNIERRVGTRGITLFRDSILAIGSGIDFIQTDSVDNPSIYNIKGYSFGVFNDGDSLLYLCKESGFLLGHNYTKKTNISYSFSDSITKTLLWTAYKDNKGTIWVGSSAGIGYLDKAKEQIVEPEGYNEFEELRSSSVYSIHENTKGLWLSTSSGLYLWDYEKGAQVRYHSQNTEYNIPHNIILHLHEDKDGLFWLASKGGGLIRLDTGTGKTKQFTMQDGLANNVLYGVYEDNYDNLWFSSNWGITQFNKKTYLVNNYTQENGLMDNEFNTTSHYQDKYGKIYFGSQDGITIVEPNNFQQKTTHYPLRIVSAQKLKAETDEYVDAMAMFSATNSLELETEDKGFKLEVALLDYRNPKTHKYAYKIEGVHSDWHYQTRPVIEERNLPYGTYQIQIKVLSFDGDWVEMKEAVLLTILRPFYLTWWFLLLVTITFLILIIGIIRWRTQQLRTRQVELENIVQQRTQKIVQQAEDLRALDKVKSRFFANISHELRTPLTLIIGPASALLKRKKENLDQEQKQGLTTIKNNGEHLLNLIEEILDLSKLEANKLELEEEPIDLYAFIQNVFVAFEQQATYLNIDYTLVYNPKENLHILLDSNKMEKVLNNLLSNALKFTPSGKHIRLLVNELDSELEILIEDSGIGIDSRDLPHVFERFYQSKQPDKPAQGGTGIGLALVKEFVDLMDGQVSVKSELGKGSSFRICLPKQVVNASLESVNNLESIAQNVEQEDVVWQPTAKQFTVLLVEDHSDMRNFIASLLEPNYTLYSATDGLEGLAKLEEDAANIDLIISDVMMPNMDGFAMLERIKANEKWRMIPMIMLTARAAEKDKLHALVIGVDDYLTKPFSVDELLVRVANLLQNAQARKAWQQEEYSPKEESSPKLEEQETNVVSSEDLEWIQKIELLIGNKLENTEFNVTALAKELFISERQLRRRLKKVTGLTPVKLLKEIRLKTAKQYLEEKTKKSVTEVAFSVGFQSLEYFSRSFKKRYGKLPSAYLSK
ncbi:MAG: response regulator [Aureispira sp.]|nr:response regulator [Aureispira sp.]